MTGTTEEFRVVAAAWPQLGMKAIAEVIQGNIEQVGMPQWSEEEQSLMLPIGRGWRGCIFIWGQRNEQGEPR